MGHTANVPDLHKNLTAIPMNFIGDQLPSSYLRLRIDTGRPQIAFAMRRYIYSFGNN
jgi:hypothetical protein